MIPGRAAWARKRKKMEREKGWIDNMRECIDKRKRDEYRERGVWNGTQV